MERPPEEDLGAPRSTDGLWTEVAARTEERSEETGTCDMRPKCPEEASWALSRSLQGRLAGAVDPKGQSLTVALDGAAVDQCDGMPFDIPGACKGTALRDYG